MYRFVHFISFLSATLLLSNKMVHSFALLHWKVARAGCSITMPSLSNSIIGKRLPSVFHIGFPIRRWLIISSCRKLNWIWAVLSGWVLAEHNVKGDGDDDDDDDDGDGDGE